MREPTLTIRDISEASGLSPHTLRYYERIGLMVPVSSNPSGHRRYSSDEAEWVTLLRHLRETGMPIAEMLRFAELVRGGVETVPDRLDLLRDHRDAMVRQIETIMATLAAIDAKIATYECGAAPTPPFRTRTELRS